MLPLARLPHALGRVFHKEQLVITFFWAALVGVIGGFSTVIYHGLIRTFEWLLTGYWGGLISAARSLPPLQRMLVPSAGGFLAGLILYFGLRKIGGKYNSYMEAVAVGDGVVGARKTLVKCFSSMTSAASGGSLGKEGAMVQMSAMLASVFSRTCGLTDARLRLMVACGAAAGMSTAFNAPIAGALFVSELVYGSIAMETFGALLMSAAIAALVERHLVGFEPLYATTNFSLISTWELLAYLVLGVVAGVASSLFMGLLDVAKRVFNSWSAPVYLRMGAGGLVSGAVSVYCPQVWGNGYGVIHSMLTTHWALTAVLIILACKLLATSAIIGSGGVGGVFTPSLFVGTALGNLVGILAHHALPQLTGSPQAYAVVGMGCFLAATTKAPLMALVMVLELTGDSNITMPLMIAVVTAYFVSLGINDRSVYSEELKTKPGDPEHVPTSAPAKDMSVHPGG